MNSVFVNRIIRACRLDITLYEEVEADQSATLQAALVVILSSIAAGIGAISLGASNFLMAPLLSLVSWYIWAYLIYFIGAKLFPEARKPAYILHVDFGPEVGMLKSSAQITDLYSPDDLVGKQVLGVVNFPKKQIGPVRSECLITGFTQADGSVVLAQPEQSVANGIKLA